MDKKPPMGPEHGGQRHEEAGHEGQGRPKPGDFPPGPMGDVKYHVPAPKSLKEVPGFIHIVTTRFFGHLIYMIKLVIETGVWIILSLTALAVLQGLIPVAQAFVGAQILNVLADAFTSGGDNYEMYMQRIMGLIIALFACIVGSNVVAALKTLVVRVSGERVVNHVNIKIMEKAKRLDVASFDRPDFYAKLENASRESGNQPIRIIRGIFDLASCLLSIVSFIIILWGLNPLAPLLILLVSIPTATVSMTFRKKNFLYLRIHSKERRQLDYYKNLTINKDIVKEIRVFRLGDTIISRYKEIFGGYFNKLQKIFIQEGASNLGMNIISALANCYLFFYVAKRVALGLIKVGDYSLYTGALNSISSNVHNIIEDISDIYESTLFIDNMIVFMEEEENVVQRLAVDEKEPDIKKGQGHVIQFENVCFSYPNQDREVLKNINVTLHEGEHVVLVGLNGAGKTTFLKLLTRLYDPTSGRILLDGVDIRKYDTNELYKLYGIIFQDFGKYAVSVKENVAFGNIESIDEPNTEKAVETACQFGNATDFIERLPMKYNTPLMRYFEEKGIELSIGQWQKLSIARAYYSDADILILDEPTASLDAIAEQEIYNRFEQLSKNKTTVFVSHRLSSATTADNIIVLEYGRVVEEGTHKELMQKKGQYYTLFSTQAKRYQENME